MTNIGISRPQMNFLQSVAPSTGFVAGLGSGKSFIGTLKVLQFKLKYPTIKAAYYLPTYGLVRDIAFDKFPELCSQLGLEYTLNKSDKELHINGYGKIIFRTMSEPESIIGYEVGYSLIDETDNLPLEKMTIAYENITARNRQKLPDNEPNRVDVVGTPEGFKWFYTNFKKEPISGSVLIEASTYSNLHNLPEDYIDKLSALFPPNRLEAYLNGKFVNLTSGQVYPYFDRERHHTTLEISPSDALHIGQDFNVGGCCSAIFIIKEDRPILVNELVSNDTMTLIKNLKELYPNRDITIYPDASGYANRTNATKSDITMLREAGFRINAPSHNGAVIDRVNSVNVLLSNNNFLINTNKCPKSTEALEQQVYNVKGEPEKFNGAATVDDWSDAIGYFLVRKYGIIKTNITIRQRNFT